jgi:hypothetical protein
MALLGKNLVPSDLAIRDRLENKFQLPTLEGRFIEWQKRLHRKLSRCVVAKRELGVEGQGRGQAPAALW